MTLSAVRNCGIYQCNNCKYRRTLLLLLETCMQSHVALLVMIMREINYFFIKIQVLNKVTVHHQSYLHYTLIGCFIIYKIIYKNRLVQQKVDNILHLLRLPYFYWHLLMIQSSLVTPWLLCNLLLINFKNFVQSAI